jgi:hypothetical protein
VSAVLNIDETLRRSQYMVEQVEGAVKHYEIQVNRQEFDEDHAQRTGLEIKQDAIAAGVKIKVSFVLEEETEGGNLRISDDQVVKIRSGLKFLAHPGGSDS